MKHSKTSFLLVLVGMMFLMGCAHFQQQLVFKYIPWPERKVKLQQNKNWFVCGSFSITYNKKRDIARFEWEQHQDSYAINISGPLNLNRIKIIGNANKVELCQSGDKCAWAKSSEKLFFNRFGWWLPISNIRYWALALPAPAKIEAIRFDQYGHLIELEQQGWKINYSEFQSKDGIDLPDTIEMQNKNLSIKLKISERFLKKLLNQTITP